MVDQHQSLGRARRGQTLYVAVPAGPLVVRLAYSSTSVPAAVHVLRRGIVLASLLSLVVATLLAAWLAQLAAKRLARIVVFANRIAAGDLSARVEEGNLDEISAVAHALDVTASRLEHSFHALESSRSELAALLDSMQEAVIAINPQGQVSWCNAVMQRISLSPVQEGRTLVHSIRDPEVLSAVGSALTLRQASRRRATSVSPGKIFEVNAAPMPGGGAVAVLHDVSEIERSETTRRDFVANVSHELRTPLTCITGYVETLLDDAGLSNQAREFLQIILKNAARMNRLTEDLLALASVESGDYKLRLQKIQASRLVEEAVGSLAGLVLDSAAVLEVGETTDEPVMADLDALSQVFGNLVENAMKYGKAGGRVRVGARKQEAMVEFYVQDFGPGIAYEHLPRIFERFYRVDKARSRESGGTGLGLSIAKHIVQAHGGPHSRGERTWVWRDLSLSPAGGCRHRRYRRCPASYLARRQQRKLLKNKCLWSFVKSGFSCQIHGPVKTRSQTRLRIRIIFLRWNVRKTIWLLAAAMSATVCVGHAQKLNGAGATFPYPIYSKWFSEYMRLPSRSLRSITSRSAAVEVSARLRRERSISAPATAP